MNKKLIYLTFILFLLIKISYSTNSMVIFYGQGCPHCEQLLNWMNTIEKNYSNININKLEVYQNSTNRELFEKISNNYNKEIEGVPTVFINDKVIIGFSPKTSQQILNELNYCSNNACINPLEYNSDEQINNSNKLTILTVITGALIDAINPCAFAVLILLITTISLTLKNSKNKKKVLFAGIAFSTSIFISYYLMGIGIYSALNYSKLNNSFYLLIGVLSIILGIFNIKDFFWYGKGFLMEVPLSWRPKLKSIIKGVTSTFGSFLIGFIVSLFLLPCTSGPYIVILGLLTKSATSNYAKLLLLLYNLIFITPMIIITLIVYFGIIKTEKIEKIRKKNVRYLHLIGGILLLIMGLYILL